jgi:hypothetical protein
MQAYLLIKLYTTTGVLKLLSKEQSKAATSAGTTIKYKKCIGDIVFLLLKHTQTHGCC